MADPGDVVEDDLLRLVLLCAHPALAPEAASALSLRLVSASRPTTSPGCSSCPSRRWRPGSPGRASGWRGRRSASRRRPSCRTGSRSSAEVAYLAFTAGYAPGSGRDLLRADVAGEAIRLVRVVRDLLPGRAACSTRCSR